MGLLGGSKLGRRVLRRGAGGADVRKLQQFLSEQGYDLGREKNYGYLTQDAVRRFQKEHGLVADGIAGPRFFALILQKNLPIRRRVHVVNAGETLAEVAKTHGLAPGAFTNLKEAKPIYPGQRLVFFHREIWGSLENTAVDLKEKSLTGLIGPLAGGGAPSVYRTDLGGDDGVWKVHQLLQSRQRRRQAAQKMLAAAVNHKGLYVPWKEVAPLDGRRYLSLLRQLKKKLPAGHLLFVELGPGIPHWKIWGGVDYSQVNRIVDRVVLSLPIPCQPGPVLCRKRANQLLNYLLPTIHSWKILLQIPVFAVEWEVSQEGTSWIKLPYGLGLSRAFRYGARLEQAGEGGLFYRYQRREKQFYLQLPQYNVFADILNLANLYNLAGVALSPLGMEDPRIWGILPAHFRAARL